MQTGAGIIAILTGLGFGVPGLLGMLYFARHRTVWTLMGFPTYGSGPFERSGIPTTIPLLAGFVVVCAAEILVGLLLVFGWNGALWLSIALLPFELAYWYGFALPFGFVLGAIRAALVIGVLLSAA